MHDQSVVKKCAGLCVGHSDLIGIEVGPGMGVLTREIKDVFREFEVYEIDSESVNYLQKHLPNVVVNEGDFLKAKLPDKPTMVVGNFPYNISTQIVFKILDSVENIPVWMGMFQLEVAERICASHGNKQYGILSVLTQFYYNIELEFKVKPGAFHPPPKVQSGVLYASRKKEREKVNETLLFQVVKTAFGQRRKQLRNPLKKIVSEPHFWEDCGFSNLRPEQMAVGQFVELTQMIETYRDHG